MIEKYYSNQFNLHSRITGFFTRNGKKSKVTKFVSECFFEIARSVNKPVYVILRKIFLLLNVFVETKNVKIRRRRYIIPFPVSRNRRLYLALKWLGQGLRLRKQRIPLFKRLKAELLTILINKKRHQSSTLKFKRENIAKAVENRSNIHYRW